MRGSSSVATLALLLAASCGGIESSPPPPESEERAVEAIAKQAPSLWAKYEAPAPACATPAPLVVHHDGAGRVDRLHVTLTARGITGEFLVDTGSLKSFATHSGSDEPDSANTTIACSTTRLPIIARLRPGATPEGRAQVGVLGSDLVGYGAVLDLDLKNGVLGWYQPAPPPPAGAIVIPIERRRGGWLVASGIKVGGRDVKLVVDTGATNVILIDKTARAGEVKEETVDGTASKITLWHGEGTIAFGDGLTRHVPVDRSDDFPTLQGLIAELGGDVAGLLGLTSLGRDRIVIGRDAMYVMLPPAPPNPL